MLDLPGPPVICSGSHRLPKENTQFQCADRSLQGGREPTRYTGITWKDEA